MKTYSSSGALLCAFFFAQSISLFAQGSLTPPAAPAPTMKTLAQIRSTGIPLNQTNAPGDQNYHLVINQAGSYFLTANLDVTKPNGIHVAVAGVSIDLNGFQIARSSGSGGDGITVDPAAHRCAIKDGSISGFAYGVQCPFTYARSGSLLHVTASACSVAGLYAGVGWQIDGCTTHDNTGAGIFAAAGCALSNCTAAYNGGNGIATQTGCTLHNCTATANQGSFGISALDGSTLSNCTASYNSSTQAGAVGLRISDKCTMTHSIASNNSYPEVGSRAISAGNDCVITDSNASSNTADSGINTGNGSTLANCTASDNTSASSSSGGIGAGFRCTIQTCTASANISTYGGLLNGSSGAGISAANGSLIRNCSADSNTGDGIQISAFCQIRDNACDGNGPGSGSGAGIHVTGAGNRLEANNVTRNDRGIDVDAAGNVIIRNTSGRNTNNYAIAAGNHYGPIVDDTDETATAAPAASGNSATGDVNSNHPWANFAF